MIYNHLKTFFFLGILSSLLIFLGALLGGNVGIYYALIFALIFNGIMYFFSDKIILRMYNAQPLNPDTYQHIHEIVHELSQRMNIPKPRLFLVNTTTANAFATGRNPHHATVTLTRGIIDLLNADELRGVLAHELSHIKNRDILIATVAAVLSSAICSIGDMLYRQAIWNSFMGNKRRDNGSHPAALFISAFLLPFAATLVQLALSRSREYYADDTGARACQDPLALAAALEKLQSTTRHAQPQPSFHHASMEAVCIVHSFTPTTWTSLFATHPPIHKRIARLHTLYAKMFLPHHTS
ncbi:MAG TPA: M48 family metalloprotease [Candidatus Bathyarchaeia archaeon]|nr:M48 family metalloprotease [Candidatus Bathyarchaeia archaeon]